MSVKIEIPDDFFKGDEKENLKMLFSANTDEKFREALNKVVLAALDEYRDMFLGMGLPARANEIREFRLFYLIKRYFDLRIPDELEVSTMFQLPQSRAKTLILYVLTRFRYNLEEEINETLKNIVSSAEKADDAKEYGVFIGSENMVDELDRIITKFGGLRLKKLTKMRNESNMYSIAPDSYKLLYDHLKIKEYLKIKGKKK
jgi:hypothetical protein